MLKKNKKETIVIFSGYALPHLGGIERYTNNLSLCLINKGYHVVIVSSNYTFDNKFYIDNEDMTYIKLPVYKLFVSRYPIVKKNNKFKQLIGELNDFNIKAIIVNTRFHLTSLVGAKYGKKHNIPVFLIEHGSQHLTVDNKILDFFGSIYEHCLTSVVKRYVDQYYGVSNEACKWQKHFNIESNGVWYNSINDFSKDIKIKKSTKSINFLYAGRVLKQKGIIELLESFSELEKKYDNIKLTIAGDGNLLNEVKEKYNSKNICFLGKVNFDELKKLYSRCNVFVYAPIWPEGLPTSILEAGLMKCSVIGSPQGGIKEIIKDNETGLMISNSVELYESMKMLIDDEKLRNKLANNLEKYIRNNFLWDTTSNKVIKDINSYIKKEE